MALLAPRVCTELDQRWDVDLLPRGSQTWRDSVAASGDRGLMCAVRGGALGGFLEEEEVSVAEWWWWLVGLHPSVSRQDLPL